MYLDLDTSKPSSRYILIVVEQDQAVEVVLEFWRHYEERVDRDDPQSTQALVRAYLERQVKEDVVRARGA